MFKCIIFESEKINKLLPNQISAVQQQEAVFTICLDHILAESEKTLLKPPLKLKRCTWDTKHKVSHALDKVAHSITLLLCMHTHKLKVAYVVSVVDKQNLDAK
jgi:hypothetical protein